MATIRILIQRAAALTLAMSLFLIQGCSKAQARQPKHLTIGVLAPMSGDHSDKGRDCLNGILLAVEDINEAGGIPSLGGARFEVVLGDTWGDPELGGQQARRLIEEERVLAIIGSYQSEVTTVATQVAEKFETPFLVYVSIADILMERGFRYSFRIQPNAIHYARAQVGFLLDLEAAAGYKVRRVALIHENTDSGASAAMAQKRALWEAGIDVAVEVSYEAVGVSDLRAEVAEVLAARPDAVLEITQLKDSVLIRRELAKAGSTVPLLDLAGGTVSPEYVRSLGELAEGTLSVVEFSKHASGGQDLDRRFRESFGADITGGSAYAYQAVLVLADALERAGTSDRRKLRDAIAATDMPRGERLIIPAERIRFDESGQNEDARLFIAQIRGGEWVPVWPPDQAVGRVALKASAR
jgi:branched-chain amino acid transport system substrate-binding protein